MSKNETKEEKKRYEPPALIPLGELDKGIGQRCGTGGTPAPACSPGSIVDPEIDCTSGVSAIPGTCLSGTGAHY